mgnify:CR=1 FL=1|tara:strand:- start:353 stop:2533 length:2181 start_codon:yes stop_codon:yes gene_type:complete
MLVEATSVKTVADRVFNLLKGYGFQIDTYNKMGEVVGDPADAIRFFVEDPNLLVTLNVPKEEIRLSISDNTDQTDTLRKQLSEIAKDYLMMLDFRVFGKTLKPSSEAINISRESDMKEQNEIRKLAGLEPINEDRTVVGCKDGKELYIFLGNEQIDLGQSEEEVASKLLSLGDKVDFDDMFYSSSMDFARECGFASNDGAKKLMDKAIDLMMDMKFAKSGEKISADMPKMDFDEAEEGPGGVEDCIRMVLRKEGGAAGLGAIEDACKKAGFEDDVKSVMSSMSDVEQHSEGDYLLKEEEVEELNDLRKRAGLPIKEKYKYANTEEKLQDMIDSHQATIDDNHPEEIKVFDHEDAIQWYEDLLQQHKETGEDTFEAPSGGDTAWRDDITQEMKDVGLYKPAETFRGIDNLPEQESKEAVEETIVVEASLGSMRGSIKTSNQPLGGTKIIVKHTKAVNEEVRGARSRNIQKIFIENNEERFLFPSKNLNGARAMARHLYNGGQMHDTVGESIVAMCTELKTLKEFANYVKKQGLINEENNDYVELARQHIKTIKETFKKLSGVKTYSVAVESLKDVNNIDIVNEVNLEDHFTETHYDDKVGNAHETLSKLVNKQSAFESMIMSVIETEQFAGVKELISEDPLDFATPEAKLGHQVSQLGATAKNPELANYLGSISNKLSNGGQMNQFEYRAVKASLLSAQRPEQAQMAEQFTEEQQYTKFIESFITEE